MEFICFNKEIYRNDIDDRETQGNQDSRWIELVFFTTLLFTVLFKWLSYSKYNKQDWFAKDLAGGYKVSKSMCLD